MVAINKSVTDGCRNCGVNSFVQWFYAQVSMNVGKKGGEGGIDMAKRVVTGMREPTPKRYMNYQIVLKI